MNFIFNNEDTVMYAGKLHTVMGRFHNEEERVYTNKNNPSKNMYFLIPQDEVNKGDEERWSWIPETQIQSI